MFQGKGILEHFVRKERYEGDFVNSHYNGQGVLQRQDLEYKGQFKDNEFHGIGRLITDGPKERREYKGIFIQGKREGWGREKLWSPLIHNDLGERYEGRWHNDQRHGHGLLIDKRLGTRFEGMFKSGYKEGSGEMVLRDKTVIQSFWKDDRNRGLGIIHYPNGSTYEGQCFDLKAQGSGTMIYQNGVKFEGNFVNNMREGEGKLYFKNGEVFQGTWHQDMRADGA